MFQKYIYLHICTLGEFVDIVQKIIDTLSISGLWDEVDEVRYGVLGNEVDLVIKMMNQYPKTKCIFSHPDTSFFERATLHRLREDCLRMTEPAHILYLHSKGITKRHVDAVIDRWTVSMLDGLTTYRSLCWRALEEGNVTVGSFAMKGLKDIQGQLLPVHFSGNFWWARSDHVASLPLIGPDYLDPEMWILGSLSDKYPYTVINDNKTPFLAYCSAPSVEEYRRHIVFRSLSKMSLERNDMKSVEVGLEKTWVTGTLPAGDTKALKMNLKNLRILTDPFPNMIKMVRITMISGAQHYLLENEILSFF
jgi:hypothetical protein